MLMLTDFVLVAVLLLIAILSIRAVIRHSRKPLYLSPEAQQPHRFVPAYAPHETGCQWCHKPKNNRIHQVSA